MADERTTVGGGWDPSIPDFVKEAEAAMARGETIPEMKDVTIKFGKGLVGEPFTSKKGTELVEVKIPNPDPADKRPWESFVVSPKMIHDNKFGKGVWMKLPEEGTTRLSRPVETGVNEAGKRTWGTETRTVSNTELKALMESYKNRDKESVMNGLSKKSERGSGEKKPKTKGDDAR